MKALLIGTGAVGIGIAASLLSQGVDVSLYSNSKTASAIRKNGIKRVGLFKHYSFSPSEFSLYCDYNDIPKNTFDYVFITSKSVSNDDISNKLNEFSDILKENFKIIIFQNGFGNDEPYLRFFKKDEVFCARLITGFTRHERYISEITVYTEPVLLGSLQGCYAGDLNVIADIITKSGLKCEVTDHLDKYLWAKMLYNCTLNPLGAILDVTYGKLTENEYSVEIMNKLIDEIFNVIDASPYSTLWESSEEYKDVFYSRLVPDTYNHYSSTHQDIKMKIKTEIDNLNGKIIDLGLKYDVDVTYNKIIYNMIKAIEADFI